MKNHVLNKAQFVEFFKPERGDLSGSGYGYR